MQKFIPTIPGLPPGWEPVSFFVSDVDPRAGVVLCKNLDNQHTPFVCWNVNMIEGGCHHGSYCNDYEDARLEFSRRVSRRS